MHNSVSAAALVKHYAARFHTRLNDICTTPIEDRTSREIFAELYLGNFSITGFGNIVAKIKSDPSQISLGSVHAFEPEAVIRKYALEGSRRELLALFKNYGQFPVCRFPPEHCCFALPKDFPDSIEIDSWTVKPIDVLYGEFYRGFKRRSPMPEGLLDKAREAFGMLRLPMECKPSGPTPRLSIFPPSNPEHAARYLDLKLSFHEFYGLDSRIVTVACQVVSAESLIVRACDSWEGARYYERDSYRNGLNIAGDIFVAFAPGTEPSFRVAQAYSLESPATVCEKLCAALIAMGCLTPTVARGIADLPTFFDSLHNELIRTAFSNMQWPNILWRYIDQSSAEKPWEGLIEQQPNYDGPWDEDGIFKVELSDTVARDIDAVDYLGTTAAPVFDANYRRVVPKKLDYNWDLDVPF